MSNLGRFSLFALLPMALAACGPDAGSPPAVIAESAGSTVPKAFRAPNHDIAAVASSKVACALDTINEIAPATAPANVETGGMARFIGWVSDAERQAPASFRIVLEGATMHTVEAKPGGVVGRPDVARALRSPALVDAGFNVVAELRGVPLGNYAVWLLLEDQAQAWRCNTPARVTVVASPD